MYKKLKQHLDELCPLFDTGVMARSCNIFDWNEISSTIENGVYIIIHKDQIIYVGKGNIRDRQKMHIEKLTGAFNKAKDTKGFRLLREHNNVNAYDCEVYYFDCHSASAASAFEGALIHYLQPLANKETYTQYYKEKI